MEKIHFTIPRITIAGLSGDSGKTLISVGLTSAFKKKGLSVAVFKKGPDYIDAAWLSVAAERGARHLDTFLMDEDTIINSFLKHSYDVSISIIEGNRGIFDGMDLVGTHSTATIAKLLKTPVFLVLNVTKVTRTAAALVLGCQNFDPELPLAGIILNRYATERQRLLITSVIEKRCSIPVVGAIPRLRHQNLIPNRHLGLITPSEHKAMKETVNIAGDLILKHIDIDLINKIAKTAKPIVNKELLPLNKKNKLQSKKKKSKLIIGFFKDSAFTFYYPENLEKLAELGAEMLPISSLDDKKLPDIHSLYIGGGFPETHVEQLSHNQSLMISLQKAVQSGLPVYAECGGLIYLSRGIYIQENFFKMANIFPFSTIMHKKPQGHGYVNVRVIRKTPFFSKVTSFKGHEFHYSSVSEDANLLNSVFQVTRTSSEIPIPDGFIVNNVFASYVHLHALGTPQWAINFIETANQYKAKKIK